MEPKTENADISANTLSGQKLHIPDFRPTFAAWKQGVNPLHARARQAVDALLAGIIEDEKVLAKTRAVDIALFAAGYACPQLQTTISPFSILSLLMSMKHISKM